MLVAVVALAAGETALAKGMKQIDRLQGGWVEHFTALARNGWIAAGLALLACASGAVHAGPQECRPELCAALNRGVLSTGRAPGAVYLHEDVSFSRTMGTF